MSGVIRYFTWYRGRFAGTEYSMSGVIRSSTGYRGYFAGTRCSMSGIIKIVPSTGDGLVVGVLYEWRR